MPQQRLTILYACLCAALLSIAARLCWLQVLGFTDEDPDAILRAPIPLEEIPAYRGAILDLHGRPLAADEPTLDLRMDYPQFLLLTRAAGDELTEGERRFLRRRARARLRALAQNPAADPAEKLLLGGALAGALNASDEALLRALATRRLADIAALSGGAPAEVLEQARQTVRRVRRLREALPKVPVLYEETASHPIASGVAVEAAACVESDPDRFPGLSVRAGTRRCYPQGNIAPHVIGYLGVAQPPARGEVPEDPAIRPGERIGITGVEKQYDRLLRGASGYLSRETDSKTGLPSRKILSAARPGATLTLSIDIDAQRVAEATLGRECGAVAVMDLATGELRVLATAPMYDLLDIPGSYRASAADASLRHFLSRATQDSVPPGSMVKPILSLAAGEAGVEPEHPFTCNRRMTLGGTAFGCTGTHGPVAMREAVAYSCNIYYYELGRRLGAERVLAAMREMGLGDTTGVDLPHEWQGRLPAMERARRWAAGHTLNISIGQGDVRATPLQVAVAMGIIATGGKVLRPTVLHRVEPLPDPEAYQPANGPVLREVALSPRALGAVRAGMRDATLTGTARSLPLLRELKAAVKTGTAQAQGDRINHAWIGGYFPWDAPRYSFAVVVHQVEGHGSDVAGPIAEKVLSAVAGGEARRRTEN